MVKLSLDMEQHNRSASQPRVVIIGGGVSGLTTGYFLLKNGFQVTLIAEKFAEETTSIVAGALWEVPHAVCGHHEAGADEQLNLLEQWSKFSYQVFMQLHASSEPGVHVRRVHFYGEQPLDKDEETQRKINLLQGFVVGLEVSTNPERNIRPGMTIRSHYSYQAPMIDMAAYLPWLVSQIEEMGGVFVTKFLKAEDLSNSEQLLESHKAAYLIHCSGLGACALAADKNVFPVRGAWFSFRNDGSIFPKVMEGHCSSLVADSGNENFIFVIPRGEHQLLVGGIANPNISDLSLPADSPILQSMLEECGSLLPELRQVTTDDFLELRVGLRPFRKQAVRLEMDDHGIIHNYGHGGSGVLLSWGCASNVHQILCRQGPLEPDDSFCSSF